MARFYRETKKRRIDFKERDTRSQRQKKLSLYYARRLLAVAFIASRVDYCNAVLFGIPDRVVQQFQMVMNAAARFVARNGRSAHITPCSSTRCASPVAGLQENSVQGRFAGF